MSSNARTKRKKMLWSGTLMGVLIILGIGIGLMPRLLQESPHPLESIAIATMPHSFTAYSVDVALEKGYFEKEGLDIKLKSYPNGASTLKAVSQGITNFGVSSETPFMHSALNGENIVALATMITAQNHLAVVARKDRGILKPEDLKGKTIGVTIGTNGEYFIDLVLLLNGILKNEIKTVHVEPAQMVEALMKGDVDAIATWNPQMYKAQKKLGTEGITFKAEGLYTPLFLLTARRDYATANPSITKRVLRALINAGTFIHDHPEDSRKLVAPYIQMDEALLKELSATYQFKVSLEQSLLVTLEKQSEWAIQRGLTPQTEVPNYLDYIDTGL
ncbi:NrtA/SsuA/CpmA family ABC transporter substrate-binding protein [Deltaproteobacteria bacterium TL4]